ncbi:hypothetical protein [Nonomuraea sp. NPDC023979]|uniref:hypothetical protein n=1 Tax=Nonomuraea sp. NPDC023979 TaxID=3154796 RepID=UPI0033F27571
MGATISAWVDREGRVWLDTGHVHQESKEPVVELLNGDARGSLGWVSKTFGPLEELGITRSARPTP